MILKKLFSKRKHKNKSIGGGKNGRRLGVKMCKIVKSEPSSDFLLFLI